MRPLPPIGEGPPLVYLPGLDGSGELLFCQEAELAERFRLLRLPSRVEGPFTYDDLVADVVAALDAEGAERATVVAESFGGSVGLQFALAHPERVERLVVVNSFPYFANRAMLRWGRALARTAPGPVVQVFRMLVDVPALALEGVPATARNRFLEIAGRQPLAAYVRRLELLEEYDLRERIAELEVPTLFVAAERDRVVPSDDARWMAGRVEHAALRVVPHVGHAIFLTPGISLARILDEWGAGLSRAASRPGGVACR